LLVAELAQIPVFTALGPNGCFPSSRENATKLTSIIPLSSPHTRTTGFHGTRISMAEFPGTRSGPRLRYYTATPPHRPDAEEGRAFYVVRYSEYEKEFGKSKDSVMMSVTEVDAVEIRRLDPKAFLQLF
jgi:hypothetical protein